MKSIKIPTGYLLIDDYSKGQLETLSIGDYGKSKNVKADFLGYTNELHGVPNGECMPMSEKWVITLSTQYGCPMKCTFCDVPNIKFQGNASVNDLEKQLILALSCFPNVKYTERLNIHFARMGEPTFNRDVITFSEKFLSGLGSKWYFQNERNLRAETIHPVVTTSLPKSNKNLKSFIQDWISVKNNLKEGQAGLQFSINSTNEDQRQQMFAGMSMSLIDFSKMAETFQGPFGRKYCLNFAYSTDFEIDANKLSKMFNPDHFMVKITPIHNNNACRDNKIQTIGGYDSYIPYKKPEEDLRNAGFDVLVFVPSMDEENGLVTCGNAVLGGGVMKV